MTIKQRAKFHDLIWEKLIKQIKEKNMGKMSFSRFVPVGCKIEPMRAAAGVGGENASDESLNTEKKQKKISKESKAE